tara:strand:+ start:58 stop:1029 length:972 start_codon:yes stop_codon:yes gene_type:complete
MKKEKNTKKESLKKLDNQIEVKRKRRNIRRSKFNKKSIIPILIFSILFSAIVYFFTRTIISVILTFFTTFVLLLIYSIAKLKLKRIKEIKKMENSFPDFLQLMSSNLRAGMTSDQALLLSARKEFHPLDNEIKIVGKDLLTGKNMEQSLLDMSKRINSEKIDKTIRLIVSGINSGGNMAVLLEKTSVSMKDRFFVEKKAKSNILMYIIFIFFATGVGAPILFSLSSVLVDILTSILSTLPEIETSASLPFTLSSINISTTFILYYALIFLIVTDIIGALVIGLVTKGDEKQGIKFIIPLVLSSVIIFLIVRVMLKGYFSGIVG